MVAWWQFLTDLSAIGWIMLMIVAVALIEGLVVVTRMWIKHRERMAMIEKGMDPRSVDEAYPKDKV